jgi:GT2 family glycosyltransferase
MTRVAAAVISYNTREYLRACLISVFAAEPDEVVVVDNGSIDGSIEMVRSEFPSVLLHVNPSNPGYGRAANDAIELSTAEYVVLLNADTRVTPGALAALARFLDGHPQSAIVGPRILNDDGSLQPSCYPFPTPLHVLLELSGIGRLARHVPGLRNRYIRWWPHDSARAVPWVLGAAIAIRRRAIEEVGGFDEAFFMYYEEVDLCCRLQQAGWDVSFAPTSSIYHIGGASTGQYRGQMRLQWFRSLKLFYRRHYSRTRRVQLAALIKVVALFHLAGGAVRYRFDMAPDTRASIREDRHSWRKILLRSV